MNQYKARLYFIGIIVAALGLTVVGRLFIIQVLDGERYAARSRDQSQQRRIVQAHRGAVLDRNGNVLAASLQGSLKPDAYTARLRNEKMRNTTGRVYPLGEIGGSLLGYIGSEGYGLGGIEFAFDNYLRGEDGWTMMSKDGRNKRYRKIGMPSKSAKDGSNVYLTIDMGIQKITQTVLKQAVESMNAKGGMCVVMEPHTGRIFAMANEPAFNPNIPSQFTLIERLNKCISSNYEPGSTFKLVTASAAIQDHLKKEDDIIFGNNGKFEIYDQVIRDHDPFGYLTFTKALAYSSNVCFAKVATELGNDRLYRYTRDFGFGVRTGIELPGEESGIVHPVREWSGRTCVTMAIGQEISTTLLQVALAYATVANGGLLVTPQIYDKVVDNEGKTVEVSTLKPVRRILDDGVAARLRQMLKAVVDEGTGKNAAIDGVPVAGKTGTSQKPDSGKYSQSRYWSSFIGFVPVDKPVLLCAVVIDEPANAEMGGVAAAPVFKKIMSQIISHPELEFAQKILKNKAKAVPEVKSKPVPMLAGMSRSQAEKLCKEENIPYKFSGAGSVVTHQIPAAGNSLPSKKEIVIYLDAKVDSTFVKNGMFIPDCKGKDLRDAVNLLNLKGLIPYAIGAGNVRRQQPAPGSLVRPAEVCTLYCSFEG